MAFAVNAPTSNMRFRPLQDYRNLWRCLFSRSRPASAKFRKAGDLFWRCANRGDNTARSYSLASFGLGWAVGNCVPKTDQRPVFKGICTASNREDRITGFISKTRAFVQRACKRPLFGGRRRRNRTHWPALSEKISDLSPIVSLLGWRNPQSDFLYQPGSLAVIWMDHRLNRTEYGVFTISRKNSYVQDAIMG